MGLLLCAPVGLRAAAQGPALGAAPPSTMPRMGGNAQTHPPLSSSVSDREARSLNCKKEAQSQGLRRGDPGKVSRVSSGSWFWLCK